MRHCNWPRFLTFRQTNNGSYPSGEKLSSRLANLRCTKNQDGQVVYETMDIVAPNTDLVVAPLDNLNDDDAEEHIFHAMSYTLRAVASFIRGNLRKTTRSKKSKRHFNVSENSKNGSSKLSNCFVAAQQHIKNTRCLKTPVLNKHV